MTDADQIKRLREDNKILMGLLCEALAAMPEPRRGRQPGDPINWQYAAERPIRRLLADIEHAGSLRVIEGGAG